MGDFTGLRFKGTIKKELRRNLRRIALHGDWASSDYVPLYSFSGVLYSYRIPTGELCYMPEEWTDFHGFPTDGFDICFNENTGLWSFQCSLENYDNTIERFFDLVPYLCESVEHAEVFHEHWDTSVKYELIDSKMVKTSLDFISYYPSSASDQ